MAFEDTANKAAIRKNWDLPILQNWQGQLQRPLAYFGLPGPEIRDLLDWRSVLSNYSAVESIGRTKKQKQEADETVGRMNMNAMVSGLSSGLQILRADVEDVLVDGIDSNGTLPLKNDGQPLHKMRFQYDIVNLDFDGGFGYRDGKGTAKRVNAIKKLFERQQGHDFIFFLTVNVRDTMHDEFDDYLRGLHSRDHSSDARDLIDWYLSRGDGERVYKLKAAIACFVHLIAETRMFKCLCHPPISYEGFRRAQMLHFAFELKTQGGNLRAYSEQAERDLISLPLLQSDAGELKPMSIQHPGFDSQSYSELLTFLPATVCDAIMALVLDTSSGI